MIPNNSLQNVAILEKNINIALVVKDWVVIE